MELPEFKYHPDPVATGSIAVSAATCPVCKQSRGYAYTALPYGTEDVENICPWCIADGSAHKQFGVEFTDPGGIGDYQQWENVPSEVVEEIAFRTPGFSSWQSERWYTHCGDAAEFLGPMGKEDFVKLGPEVVETFRVESGLEGDEWEFYFSRLNRKFDATAYLFRCRQCGKLGGYSDCH